VVSNVGTAGTDGFHLYLGTADSAQLNFQPFLTTVSCPTDFVAIATGPFLSDPNHVMGEGMYFGGSNPKVSADFSTLGATAMILEVRDQDGKLILSNYLANGAAVNINNLFPPPCTNTTTVYSYGQTPDHICYRFCKYGCDCSGTNCYIERVACFRPDLATLPLNLHLTDLELRAAGSAPFGSFTIQSEEIGKFGLRHGAIGQAQFDAQPDLLVVENLGSSGQDGVFVDLKAAGKFDMMLAPVLLENQSACWEMEAIGRVNSMANSPIGAVLFMHQVGPGGGCLVSADFSVIGSTQTRVEIYHASQFVGSTIIAGTSLGRMPLHGNIIDAGVVAQPSPGFRVLYDGIFSFIAANGNSFTGDEIRMLAANPAERVQSISEFAVLSCGTGQFAILGELAPPVLLNVSRQGTGPFEIDGQGVAGTMYTLQATSSLAAPIQWTPVDSVVSDPDGSFHLVDPRTTVFTQQFYRVVTSQP
jgi:hypothetical protein